MGIVTVAVQVSTDDLVPAPLNGVQVRIYDALDAFLAQGITGAGAEPAGRASFALNGTASPGTSYIARLFKAGVTFTLGPTQTLAAIDPLGPSETNIFDVEAHVATLPESIDPDLCRVSGYLTDASLRAVANVEVEFEPNLYFPLPSASHSAHFGGNPSVVRRNVLVRTVKVKTDKDGFFQVDLPRKGTYDVHVYGSENPISISERYMYVPDAAGAAFEEIFYCYVKQVIYDPAGPLNITLGTPLKIAVDVVLSDTRQVSSVKDLGALLSFSIADATMATVKVTDDSELTLEGVAAGTTTLEVTRVNNTAAPRRPELAGIIVTPPSVVVA